MRICSSRCSGDRPGDLRTQSIQRFRTSALAREERGAAGCRQIGGELRRVAIDSRYALRRHGKCSGSSFLTSSGSMTMPETTFEDLDLDEIAKRGNRIGGVPLQRDGGSKRYVWTTPSKQERSGMLRRGRVRSCVRATLRGPMTAGPDAIRSLAPKQIYALEWRITLDGFFQAPGSTGSPSRHHRPHSPISCGNR
jgi:hypothetical protein